MLTEKMNVTTGLSQSQFELIQQILTGNPRVEEAILYGSRAKGNFKPGSDIDITIKGKLLTLNDMLAILNQFDDSDLPQTIDLSIYHHIKNDELLSHIQRVGKSIFKR